MCFLLSLVLKDFRVLSRCPGRGRSMELLKQTALVVYQRSLSVVSLKVLCFTLNLPSLLKTFFFSPLQCRISVCPMAHPWTLLAQPPPHLSSTDCSWMMTWMWKLETSLLPLMIPKNMCAQWRHILHTGLQQRYKAIFSFLVLPSLWNNFRACSGYSHLALCFPILRTRAQYLLIPCECVEDETSLSRTVTSLSEIVEKAFNMSAQIFFLSLIPKQNCL